jgi:hypothetical protein
MLPVVIIALLDANKKAALGLITVATSAEDISRSSFSRVSKEVSLALALFKCNSSSRSEKSLWRLSIVGVTMRHSDSLNSAEYHIMSIIKGSGLSLSDGMAPKRQTEAVRCIF